jgi:hypothetical protein
MFKLLTTQRDDMPITSVDAHFLYQELGQNKNKFINNKF